MAAMRKGHPRWKEFLDRLSGPEGCNFREKADGQMAFTKPTGRPPWSERVASAEPGRPSGRRKSNGLGEGMGKNCPDETEAEGT
jgi:hypothetical protein